MTSEAFQSIIPTTNWMYPAFAPAEPLPEAFDPPIAAEQARLLAPAEVMAIRDEAVAEWLAALSK